MSFHLLRALVAQIPVGDQVGPNLTSRFEDRLVQRVARRVMSYGQGIQGDSLQHRCFEHPALMVGEILDGPAYGPGQVPDLGQVVRWRAEPVGQALPVTVCQVRSWSPP